MKKIAIFASGSGSNAENIITFLNNSEDICVNAVFSNVPDAYVLERAKKWDIPTYIFNKEEFNDPEKVLDTLKSLKTDYIILAGFLWLIPSFIIETFPHRIINIHPALLPAYGGKGMYGMNVHNAIIKAGEKKSGITIHFINEQYDKGDIIFQTSCDITPDDTPESLAEKIHTLEHKYFPEIIELVVRGCTQQ